MTRKSIRTLTGPKVVDLLLGLFLFDLGLLSHELFLPLFLLSPFLPIIVIDQESSGPNAQTFCLRLLGLLLSASRADAVFVVAAAFLLRHDVGRLVRGGVVVLQKRVGLKLFEALGLYDFKVMQKPTVSTENT